MERRPHWDDAIFTAVSGVLRDVYENGYSETQVYAVIAAVEDDLRRSLGWGNLSIPDLLAARRRAADAEKIIEQVRKVCDAYRRGLFVSIEDIEQIVDGDT